MRNVPNLAALQMFEVAARHESFTRAAEELCVTQSAVCRQVAALEARLGVRLFTRAKQRIALTAHGRDYAARVRFALERLARDTSELVAHGGVWHTVNLAVAPTFAAEWVIPRLPAFHRAHKGITVNCSVRNRPFLFSESPFDAAIYFGETIWSGTEGTLLIPEGEIVPVCSPSMPSWSSIRTPADILDLPLLHLATQPQQWQMWCALHDLPMDGRILRGPQFDQFSLLVSAAIAGLGVALVARFMVDKQLAAKDLAVPLHAPLQGTRGYFIVRPADVEPSPALVALSDWLVKESEIERQSATGL
jgi:DNA-binding transcriptional LysR family regulator